MRDLVELLGIAARVLREHPAAPEVFGVVVRPDGSSAPVSLQLWLPEGAARNVAWWALELGVAVQIAQGAGYWTVSATVVVDGVEVQAWDHCHLPEITRLTAVLDLALPGWTLPVQVPAQVLLDALDALEVAA